MSIGALAFLNPWLLAAFAALPIIWWLLRFTPPRPARIVFPATRLLAGLRSKEKTPAHSPWWLTALRILIVSLLILAFAGPIYNPERDAYTADGPLLLVVDNGWGAASRWDARKEAMAALLDNARRQGQMVFLAPTAGQLETWSAEPLSPASARQRADSLQPLPHAPDRKLLGQRLAATMPQRDGFNIVWLSDGLDYRQEAADLVAELTRLASGGGSFTVMEDPETARPLGLHGYIGEDRQLVAKVLTPGGAPRTGVIQALSSRGEQLGETTYTLAAGERMVETKLPLPLEVQNQVARLQIAGEYSAGAVQLIDSRAHWRRVGIISGESGERAQPLLSPSYYIEKALKPYADVVVAGTRNLSSATKNILARSPSVLVMTDIGQIPGRIEEDIEEWVRMGGMLIRFAGPRLDRAADRLLPVPLREGGRTLGGALSWSEPQHIAPFESSSPYYGLEVPKDITIHRQVLADPSGSGPEAQTWVRLEDGTPLVTAARRGDGWLILFHITANSDWSNLPMSGLFVEMLRRTVAKSNLIGIDADTTQEEAAAGTAEASTSQSRFLVPRQVLDGFGRLGAPPPTAASLPLAKAGQMTPGPNMPPGFYGPPGESLALNVIGSKTRLTPLSRISGADRVVYQKQTAIALTPWLFVAAFALLILETLIIFALTTHGGIRRAGGVAAIAAIVALTPTAEPLAQPAKQRPQLESQLKASLETHLAYIVTGDPEIDRISEAGLRGLSRILSARTAVEPAEPIGVNVERDELVFYPLLYWPISADTKPLSDKTLARVDAYMKQGGMIVFDTRDHDQDPFAATGASTSPNTVRLRALIGKLDIPRLEPVPKNHVLTKSFYLLDNFPGRWDGGTLWVEAQSDDKDDARRPVKADGVSSILITSNDFAAAWAIDEQNRPMLPVVPGGEVQREMAFRVGINLVMYALTGNYKADQVHLPALLERLGQ